MEKIEKIINYANSIYQNARIGVQSINNLMPNVKNKELKKELQKQLDGYNAFGDKMEDFARQNNFELKDNSFFEKVKLCCSVKMSALMGKSVRDYVQSLLVGTVMGLTKLFKDRWDYRDLSSEADALREELEGIEEDNYKALKDLLKTDI